VLKRLGTDARMLVFTLNDGERLASDFLAGLIFHISMRLIDWIGFTQNQWGITGGGEGRPPVTQLL
jgi:hypothetical protein